MIPTQLLVLDVLWGNLWATCFLCSYPVINRVTSSLTSLSICSPRTVKLHVSVALTQSQQDKRGTERDRDGGRGKMEQAPHQARHQQNWTSSSLSLPHKHTHTPQVSLISHLQGEQGGVCLMSDCITVALRAHCPLQLISFLNRYSFWMRHPVVWSYRSEETGAREAGKERHRSRHGQRRWLHVDVKQSKCKTREDTHVLH